MDTKAFESLQGWSTKEMRKFFEHTFWQLFKSIIVDEANRNSEDIIMGDIEERNKQVAGMQYRNTDMLRGGLIVLNAMHASLEDDMINYLELANEKEK